MTSPKIERALISVSDKSGLTEFARGLAAAGIEIYASGGSRRHLEEAGLTVREVAAYTGFPEMMDGRIKTLHPKIHAGILCRRDRPDDMAAIAEHGIVPFELVVVNLYPFKETISRPDVTLDEAIENIDIGGPTLIRAAAKNHQFVTVVTAPLQYDEVLAPICEIGTTTLEMRQLYASMAFMQTGLYDSEISVYLTNHWADAAIEQRGHSKEEFLPRQSIRLQRSAMLRYGENPHQSAAVYSFSDCAVGTLLKAQKLHGKELSYNNLLDLDSALAAVRLLPAPSVVMLKHNNPCGAATAATAADAVRRAWDGDPLSALVRCLDSTTKLMRRRPSFFAIPIGL